MLLGFLSGVQLRFRMARPAADLIGGLFDPQSGRGSTSLGREENLTGKGIRVFEWKGIGELEGKR
jgi:hypothetical protein